MARISSFVKHTMPSSAGSNMSWQWHLDYRCMLFSLHLLNLIHWKKNGKPLSEVKELFAKNYKN
jgi:hypothetical protein